MNRRDFIKVSAGATAATVTAPMWSAVVQGASFRKDIPTEKNLVDTNVTFGHWPFRQLPLAKPKSLVAKLRAGGVTQAWVGSFDGVFQKDLAAANARLAELCHEFGSRFLAPFGTVNPSLPAWETDLQRCVHEYQMRGIRLFPSYHGYRFDDARVAKLFSLASDKNLIVQIVADLEDERTQSPLARAPHSDFSVLPEALKNISAPVMLLNWSRSVSGELVKKLAAAGVCFDIATLEGVGGIEKLISSIPEENILFGSNAPLFYFASAKLKLQESVLTRGQSIAMCSGNAQRLWHRQNNR